MVERQAIGIDTFDRSTRVRHPDPVRFSECFYGATFRCRTREGEKARVRGRAHGGDGDDEVTVENTRGRRCGGG